MITKNFFKLAGTLLLAGMVATTFAQTKPLPPGGIAAKDRIVVMISVDGLASYYFDDPKADMPTLHQLATEGAVAERMQAVLPTVTWPNHTSLVTGVPAGKHGVIGNSYWDRAQDKSIALIPDPIFNKEEIVRVPTIYDVAHQAGLKTAGIIWPASRGAKTLDWTVPDVFTDELFQKYGTPSLLEEFRAAGIPYDQQGAWCKAGKGEDRDKMYTKMLIHVIKQHRPNFALLHLVEVDHVEHAKGPRSPEAYHAVNFEDQRLKEIKDALDANFPGKATLIVTADHGFIAYRQLIQPNVKLRQEGLLKVQGTKISERQVYALGQGGSSFIYIFNQASRAELLRKLTDQFKATEGVEFVIEPKDYKKWGLVSPEADNRMADLVLTAKPGYSFSDTATGDLVVTPQSENTLGSHGHSPFQPDMYASFVAWGAGIKPGTKLKRIQNVDVAPTAAALLGLQMQNVDGKVLKDILEK